MEFTLSDLFAYAVAAPEFLLGLVITAFLVLFVPWKSSFQPLHALLNSAEERRDELTRTWKDQKLSELTFVGITVNIYPSS